MKQRDIMTLMDAITPSIAASFLKATEGLVQRVTTLEKQLEAANERLQFLSLAPSAKDIAALVEIPKAVDLDPLLDDIETLKFKFANQPKPLTVDDLTPVLVSEVSKAFDTLPIPKDGKDADPEFIRNLVAEHTAAIPSLIKGFVETQTLVIPRLIDEAVAAIPRIDGKDGKDADPAVIKKMVDEAADALEAGIESSVDTMIGELKAATERVTADYQQAIADLPKIPTTEEVRALIPTPENGTSVTLEQLAPMVAEQVNLKVAAMPLPKDGVGLAGGMIDRDGNLILTMTDGTVRELGNVVGKDGMGIDDFEIVDGEDQYLLRLKSGDRVKEGKLTKPTIADFYKGVWSPGMHTRGALVTSGGSLWMALCDTEARPDTKDSDDWKLVVKRGRDGKDFTPVSSK